MKIAYRHRFAPLVLFCAALIGAPLKATATDLAGADSAPETVGKVDIVVDTNAAVVKGAIVTTLAKRKWTVVSANDTDVVAHLKHRGYDATLTFHYDAKHVEIVSNSFIVDSDGKHIKPGFPKRWLDALKADIPRYLPKVVLPAK